MTLLALALTGRGAPSGLRPPIRWDVGMAISHGDLVAEGSPHRVAKPEDGWSLGVEMRESSSVPIKPAVLSTSCHTQWLKSTY